MKRRKEMKLFFVRHGETDWNLARRVQGHSDIPLNEYGRYLARETAKGLKDVPFDLAYTSPLIRARETAELILEGRNIPIMDDENIKELGFGIYEGMCISGEHKAPQTDEFNKFFTDTEHYIPAPGAESVQELLERTGKFLQELYRDRGIQDKTILISSHGAAITGLLNNIKGRLDVAQFWKEGVPANCAVTIVEVEDGVPKIIAENKIYYKEPVRAWSVGE